MLAAKVVKQQSCNTEQKRNTNGFVEIRENYAVMTAYE